MRLPGIEVRSRELTWAADFNEVFFDGVRLPAEALIGQPGRVGDRPTSLACERSEARRGLRDAGRGPLATLRRDGARRTEVSDDLVVAIGGCR
jgi:alkylation response protein AidB-like acyl-CoA dehydrogenase